MIQHGKLWGGRRLSAAGAVLLVALLATGCGQKKTETPPANPPAEQSSNQPAPAPALTENPGGTTPPPETAPTIPAVTEKPAPPPAKPRVPAAETPKPEPPKETTPKAPAEVTLLAGTTVKATLQKDLASHESKAGDSFTLAVGEPVLVDGYIAIPAGATIHGEVVSAKESGKIDGKGEITLAFKSVTDAAGNTHPIDAENFYAQAEGVGDRDAAMIAGGAAAGAIIGGIVGGKKGAGLGGLIGAAAGTGTVLATKGPEVKLAIGQQFEIKLNRSLSVPPGAKA